MKASNPLLYSSIEHEDARVATRLCLCRITQTYRVVALYQTAYRLGAPTWKTIWSWATPFKDLRGVRLYGVRCVPREGSSKKACRITFSKCPAFTEYKRLHSKKVVHLKRVLDRSRCRRRYKRNLHHTGIHLSDAWMVHPTTTALRLAQVINTIIIQFFTDHGAWKLVKSQDNRKMFVESSGNIQIIKSGATCFNPCLYTLQDQQKVSS